MGATSGCQEGSNQHTSLLNSVKLLNCVTLDIQCIYIYIYISHVIHYATHYAIHAMRIMYSGLLIEECTPFGMKHVLFNLSYGIYNFCYARMQSTLKFMIEHVVLWAFHV